MNYPNQNQYPNSNQIPINSDILTKIQTNIKTSIPVTNTQTNIPPPNLPIHILINIPISLLSECPTLSPSNQCLVLFIPKLVPRFRCSPCYQCLSEYSTDHTLCRTRSNYYWEWSWVKHQLLKCNFL